MSIQETLTTINVALTIISLSFVYFTLRHSRKKDFQDQHYKQKTEYYRELINECYESCLKLDINSTPFVQMYEIKDNSEWLKYYEKEISKMVFIGFNLQKSINKNSFYIPSHIMGIAFDFSQNCINIVVSSYHSDTGIFIQKQDNLFNQYFELLNAIRSDLKIDLIDKSLKNRLSSKTF